MTSSRQTPQLLAPTISFRQWVTVIASTKPCSTTGMTTATATLHLNAWVLTKAPDTIRAWPPTGKLQLCLHTSLHVNMLIHPPPQQLLLRAPRPLRPRYCRPALSILRLARQRRDSRRSHHRTILGRHQSHHRRLHGRTGIRTHSCGLVQPAFAP